MADFEFDAQVGRLFSEAPGFSDADGFARRVESRLARSWMVRRLAIGLAGIAGGVVAAAQMLGGHLWQAVGGVATVSSQAVTRGSQAVSQLKVLNDLPIGGEVLWMALGLAVLAIVLMAARSLEEF